MAHFEPTIKKKKFLGRGTAPCPDPYTGRRRHPISTPHPSRRLWRSPHSQNPKYATGLYDPSYFLASVRWRVFPPVLFHHLLLNDKPTNTSYQIPRSTSNFDARYTACLLGPSLCHVTIASLHDHAVFGSICCRMSTFYTSAHTYGGIPFLNRSFFLLFPFAA